MMCTRHVLIVHQAQHSELAYMSLNLFLVSESIKALSLSLPSL